jgi:hypothetical protein
MSVRKLYYAIKPLIPRNVQIWLRRMLVQRQLKRHGDVWPVDEKAVKQPDRWSGWPGGKRFALVLTHDVDTARGQERCRELMALEQRMGFLSAFNFVPERYAVSPELRRDLVERGFEVAVHGLNHDGKLFLSRKKFHEQAVRINHYLKEWNSVGFVSPSMHRNLEWTHELNIEYDVSTFDTDPFEPQPDGVATVFPFHVQGDDGQRGYIELPYTLPQDFTLFVLMKEKNIDIWKKKLDWIAGKGGMALLITHPDYMNGKHNWRNIEEYPMDYYKEFLDYVNDRYEGQYWNALPKEMARFWRQDSVERCRKVDSDCCVLSR